MPFRAEVPGGRTDACWVVGIGASAGGIEALEAFFDNMPAADDMAFVVVQHLSPDFKSVMDELLGRHTKLPIALVENGMPLEGGRVYLIPPRMEMIVGGGRLLLAERDEREDLSLPIDVFFRSMARECGPRAIALVLSGGGTDGSRGIRDVHDAGGLVIVQAPESAQFDGMPRAARDVGVAQWVVPPAAMPRLVLEHVGRATSAEETASPSSFATLYKVLEDEFGLDFKHYKPTTVTRRIERRLQLTRADDLDAYVAHLRRERDELDGLYRDLLIGVTRFFRNEGAFETLETTVLPELLGRGPVGAPLRVWVAGCATGEEAYSLAILLHELAPRYRDRPVKIFASDVHRGSLEIAARAVYAEDALDGISPARLERYFVRQPNGYSLVPELRQMIVFAPHDVIKDPPFTRVDLISCRNLLIYLKPQAQQRVLGLFHFALNRGGIVFLGPSESPGSLAQDFEVIDRTWRIYKKNRDSRFATDRAASPGRVLDARLSPSPAPRPTSGRWSLGQLLGTYDVLLDECLPPSLLVGERNELVHVFSGASRFLRLRDGRPALDVFDVVEPELKMVLVGGLERARRNDSGVVYRGVRVGDGEPHDVTIRPVRSRAGGAAHLLVSLVAVEERRAPPPPATSELEIGSVSSERLAALEGELAYTKENLQAAIEALETSNEELQATNEELHASNEELQSTNEELQSVNEELYSVNAEYQRKIAELTELTNDMDNLLSTTEVGTIFLDRELAIRKFTPAAAQVFGLLSQDVGRSLDTFMHKVDDRALMDDLRRVIATGERVEKELAHSGGQTFFLRLLPYRAKGAVDGVVLTLVDVSAMKAAEDALFRERYLLNSLLDSVPDAIYFKDTSARFIRANAAAARQLGLDDARAMTGKTPFELTSLQAALASHALDDEALRKGEAQFDHLEGRLTASGEEQWSLATRVPLREREGRVVGLVSILRDVTRQKRAEEKIQEAVKRRDQFLAMLSHELRNPLSAVVTATALLKAGDVDRERVKRLTSILERQSEQMARLLDDLLEAGRVAQNKIELRRSTVDLCAVARDAADGVLPLMESRGVHLDLALPHEPVLVNGDPARLLQIQVNLLSNAAKYTPRGGRAALAVRRDGDDAVVSVKDDGVGIPKEMLETVFEMFVQSKHTLDRADGGLGLGLTLARSLAALHGGTLVAESEGEGRGSELVLRLPIASAAAPSLRAPSGRLRLSKGGSVVVVEDNADSREMLAELLLVAGYDCHVAVDGASGLSLIEELRPDVAIVDIGLPEIDGFEIARRVRRSASVKDVYLVALTGYGQSADRQKALDAGFDEHVVKPVRASALVELLGSPATDAAAES